MKLPKLQELLNNSSKRFYRGRLKDLEIERDQLDAQITELEDRRKSVEDQIQFTKEKLGVK